MRNATQEKRVVSDRSMERPLMVISEKAVCGYDRDVHTIFFKMLLFSQ